LLESMWGERDYEASYRIADQSPRKPAPQTSSEPELNETRKGYDSSSWIGQRYVLTDASVIYELKARAHDLRDIVYATKFTSNSDSQDLKKLCDALVDICEMAEPELSIIDRILRHPKFCYSVALMGAVATIRGALGI
ncbi:MAG: hypothetical protein LC648_03745, partial [Novosphingobium sp.]|nr:hypothetical protein [Novosphingobium sp.]